MPTGAPAAASSAISFVARSASACVSKATGSGLSRTASVNRLVAVLPSEEVAVTVRSTVGSRRGVERAGGRAGDDAGGRVDGEARVVDRVADRVAGVGIVRRGGDADGGAGGRELGDLVRRQVGVGLRVEGDRAAARGQQILDMQQRRHWPRRPRTTWPCASRCR